MLNADIVNEGCKPTAVVAIKVVGGYVEGELVPPGVHKVVKRLGHHQVEVEGGEVQD
jgi:hypothetical protein